ncbi:uncharacterized membrane protein YhaH (DUF805 family) [Kribbella aluminosa]|uniref:Uncharacterized membrane protein YhaH (DUF805 family) n=1 Tax=Kribbella aluminosa TaxID=416017 RepID=A0ABS4V0C9_9ACTN|nr:DUF805 domain-containing protein [Kribbella aluminosa]MBP2357364.1 uncharacterized membrane protein YhaH (DUF805 family) [Kribbella aluminosa]
MQWYIDVLKKYAVFDGRARRKEYWMFVLFSVVASIILSLIDRILGTTYNNGTSGVLQTIYSLAVLLPTIGVAIRRMHDTKRSGWWILINLIPCIGWIWFIVLAAQEGTAGQNEYGPDPKAAERFGGPGQAGPAEPGYPTV